MLACLEKSAAGAGADRTGRAQVVVEELLVNTLTYGDAGDDPWAEITMSVDLEGDRLEVVLRDSFRAFDPFAALSKVREQLAGPQTASERVGLGRLLAADLPSERSYRRDNGCNEVRLVFS